MSPRVKKSKFDKYLMPGKVREAVEESAKEKANEKELELSGYRIVWIFAMFDLPVTSPEARKEYTLFRRLLLEEGFEMFQFSVYGRAFASEEASESQRKKIKDQLPPEGQVRLLLVTDKQFGKMEVFNGAKRTATEVAPPQLTLF